MISSFSCPAVRPVDCSVAAMPAINSLSASCRPETFAHITSGAELPKVALHDAICRHDAASVKRPMSTIMPVSSAMSMNSAGANSPRSG